MKHDPTIKWASLKFVDHILLKGNGDRSNFSPRGASKFKHTMIGRHFLPPGAPLPWPWEHGTVTAPCCKLLRICAWGLNSQGSFFHEIQIRLQAQIQHMLKWRATWCSLNPVKTCRFGAIYPIVKLSLHATSHVQILSIFGFFFLHSLWLSKHSANLRWNSSGWPSGSHIKWFPGEVFPVRGFKTLFHGSEPTSTFAVPFACPAWNAQVSSVIIENNTCVDCMPQLV